MLQPFSRLCLTSSITFSRMRIKYLTSLLLLRHSSVFHLWWLNYKVDLFGFLCFSYGFWFLISRWWLSFRGPKKPYAPLGDIHFCYLTLLILYYYIDTKYNPSHFYALNFILCDKENSIKYIFIDYTSRGSNAEERWSFVV